MPEGFSTGYRRIGDDAPCYVIAEMSANHNGELKQAVDIVHAAKEAGADCIKVQTYTPDTLTIDSDNRYFHIEEGTWKGENLYRLYQRACMPWEWQRDLFDLARKLGLDFLSTAYDATSVDFLENLGVGFYKIASFEITDLPLLERVAATNKPVLLSTGMASLGEIDDAVKAFRTHGNDRLCLLKCSSAYPAVPEDMNLRTIPHLRETFGCPVGLSDHTLSSASAAAAVALGAKVVEKHFCISRKTKTPDSSFSMEAHEFRRMVDEIREVERSLGSISYELSPKELQNKQFRRSIFAVKDIRAGECLCEENIRVIRPGNGLLPKHYPAVLGRRARVDIERGTPMSWTLIE